MNRQVDPCQPFACLGVGLFLLDSPKQRPGNDVVYHAAPGKQGIGLKDEADAWIDAIDRRAHDPDFTCRRLGEPGNQVQRGGLSAAGWTYHGHKFAARHTHVEVAQRGHGLAVRGQKASTDVDQFNRRAVVIRGHGSAWFTWRF